MAKVEKIDIPEGTNVMLVDSLEYVYESGEGNGRIDFEDIGKEISDADMVVLAAALKRQYPITSITFYQFTFTASQIDIFFDGLEASTTIQVLYFDEPNFDDFDNLGYVRLRALLEKSTSLQKLTLTFCDLSESGAHLLGYGLRTSSSLIGFKLTSSHLLDDAEFILIRVGTDIIQSRQAAANAANFQNALIPFAAMLKGEKGEYESTRVESPLPQEFHMILDTVQLRMFDDVVDLDL